MKPNIPSLSGVSPVVEHHKAALDRALRQALGTAQAALRRQALDDAALHLIHPQLVLDSPLLTDSHPWRREALIVADAFESVTNGMEEPLVLEALDDLEEGSPFQPWRHLVLAIHFFYEGLDEAVEAHLARIPRNSPVAGLARTLDALVHLSVAGLPGALGRLADEVSRPDPVVQQCIQDVTEGLEADDEDLFFAALADWLDAVVDVRPDRARAAVVWAWTQLEWRDFDEATLITLGTNLWGRAEACRLAALGTVAWDPEGAALLWFRYLISGVRDGDLDETSAREVRGLLDRFQAAAGAAPDPEWTAAWEALAQGWNGDARERNWPDLAVGAPVARTAPAPRPSVDGQLDLFSM